MGWDEKYRPRTFEAVVGQPVAVARCLVELRGQSRSIVFGGPTGTGKTSLAEIFAAARLCGSRGSGASSCGKCESCQAIHKGANALSYNKYNCARLDAAGVEQIIERTRSHPFGGNYRVILLDEAHRLTPKSADKFLTVMQDRSWNIFLFATTEAAKLPRTLRNRCSELELTLVDSATAIAHLRNICAAEGVQAEPEALELIAYQAAGHVRPLLQYLEDCVDGSVVTAACVRRQFRLDFCDDLTCFVKASLAGEIEGAQQVLDRLHGDPSRRRDLVHGTLVEVYWRDELRLRPTTSVFSGISTANREAIKQGFAKAAAAAGLTVAVFWETAIAFWAPGTPATGATLKMDTVKFVALLTLKPAASAVAATAGEMTARRRRRRVVRNRADDKAETTRSVVWSSSDVQKIWDAGSALLQLYGAVFNGLCVLRRRDLGMSDADFAAHGSELVHQAGQQLRRLGGGRLHYIMRHHREALNGFTTSVLFHLPNSCDELLRDWMEGFVERRFGSARARQIMHLRVSQPTNVQDGLPRHWRLIRMMSGPLDPSVEIHHDGRRQRLCDALRVPKRVRVQGLPLSIGHRFRVSESIGTGRRIAERDDRMVLLSAFADHAWGTLTTGWELSEHRDRARERDERARAQSTIEALWPTDEGERFEHIRDANVSALKESWPTDPKQRLRSWRGWWLNK